MKIQILIAAFLSAAPAVAQSTVIRTETRVVLVDAVVTDKKGNYLHDLTQKDFRVWEDNKEQTVTSFSLQSDAATSPGAQKRYLVLFFDNASSSMESQVRARDAATKFIDANAGPNRLMAVVEFSGGLRVTQNFTDDADRLKKVVSGVKFSSVSTNAGGGMSLGASFATRNVMLALRDLAKRMSAVPGRKTLIFLSGGFPLNQDNMSELTATIDACNRANVAVYPIDVRGLVAPMAMPGPRGSLLHPVLGWQAALGNVREAVSGPPGAQLSFFQTKPVSGGGTPGGGKAGGGNTGGGNTGGGTTGGGANPGGRGSGGGNTGGGGARNTGGSPSMPTGDPTNRNTARNPRMPVMPQLNDTVSGNQQVLYALASGTGGFVIVNTNDLLGGFEKIGKEQNEYYLLGYTPAKELEPGACHSLKVKVDRGGAGVRARTGYCDVKGQDVLAGTAAERDLETRAKAQATSTVKASMQAPFFYTAADTARVNVAIELPAGAMTFAKEKGKFHSVMNVVGIAYTPDGAVAARFSDAVKFDFEDKKQVEAFQERPHHYEKQFEMASGKYNLTVVFSSGAENFGKLEMPLAVEPYDTKNFALSGLALSKSAVSSSGLDASLLDDRVPLIVNNVQITPSGTNHFKKSDHGFLYAELYEPALLATDAKEQPATGVRMQIVDAKSAAVKKDSGVQRTNATPQPGNPAVPVGMRLDFTDLPPGSYRVVLSAGDAAGNQATRSADLELEP